MKLLMVEILRTAVRIGPTMRLPQDIANLLAVTIRDVIWFKDRVVDFFKSNQVPPLILKEVTKIQATTPTIKIVHYVLDELDKHGDTGWTTTRRILTALNNWKDLQTIEPDRKEKAKASLAALQKACETYQKELAFKERQEREQREKEMHATRTERGAMKSLDHALLQSFRNEFDEIYVLSDTQKRGNRFEQLLNKIFNYYGERSEGSFNRVGEQLDGLLYFDKHCYYVEARWKKQKTNAADISVLRDRAVSGFGGDTKALFISFEGFTQDCLDSLAGRTEERVILMDGGDVRLVLDCQIAFDVLLAEKQMDIVRNKRPFVSGFGILAKLGKAK
jgi:hypothetical protein